MRVKREDFCKNETVSTKCGVKLKHIGRKGSRDTGVSCVEYTRNAPCVHGKNCILLKYRCENNFVWTIEIIL